MAIFEQRMLRENYNSKNIRVLYIKGGFGISRYPLLEYCLETLTVKKVITTCSFSRIE